MYKDSNNYTAIAQVLLDGLGGAQNILSATYCITRLRVTVRDPLLVDQKKIVSSGVAGVLRPSKTTVQVIIGATVPFVAGEFKKLI